MRIKKHLLNEQVISIGNIPAGEEKTVKYDDWYFVISHAYDEDEDYEYTVYVTDSLTSKDYQYVYACENREAMMDYIARFLKNHKIVKEPKDTGDEYDESKSYNNDTKKKISEIVHNNGDILKEEYNRYLSPFMVSPVIIWSEHDESFDEIYDTLVGNGPTPTYARLANYDLKPLSNEYQRLLDTEIICLCATIDNHMLKVGIMFDDDMYNCLMACGFTPNGDGTWDISGENYTQEKAEKYYLDEYIKPCIEIAKKRLNEIHTVFDGEIYNNEKSYWGKILFGNSGSDSEPDDAGDEYNESYNPMLKEEITENDPEWMKTPLGSDEYGTFNYDGFDFFISSSYNRDDEDNYYDLTVLSQKTDNALYEFGTNDWDELIDFIKGFAEKHRDDEVEPEEDGEELNESKQLNENESMIYEANNVDDLIHQMYLYSPRLDEGRSVYTCNNYTIVVEYLTDEDQDIEDDRHYYKACLYDSEIEDETDAYITEFSYSNYGTLCLNVADYIKNNPLVDHADEDTEPEDTGDEYSELNETVDDTKHDIWHGAETEIIGLDDKVVFEYKRYKIYTHAAVVEPEDDGDDVIVYHAEIVSPGTWYPMSDEVWMDLCHRVTKWIDEHPIRDDEKEPEDTGDELDETVGGNSSWETYPPEEIGDSVKFKVGLTKYEAIFVNDNGFKKLYDLRIFNLHDNTEWTTLTFDDWDDLVHWAKRYARHDNSEPEDDGSELNESWLPGAEWLDEPTPIGYSETHFYKGYDFAIEGVRDTDGEYYSLRVFIHDITDDDDALVQQESFDTWDELAFYVRDYVDEHPIKPDKKDDTTEPETDGSELNESKENNKQPLLEEDMSWMDEPPANGSDKFITCGGYDVQIESIWTENTDLENHYIYNVTFYLHNDEEDDGIQHECVCDTWEEVCDTIKSYTKVNEPTEPETDGSELNEAENSIDDWKPFELEPGDDMLYNYKGYELDIQRLTDKDNRYDVRIFKEGDGHILEWERFHSLEEMTRFIKNFVNGQEEPEDDGSELNESKVATTNWVNDFSNEWKHSPLYAGEEVTYNYKGYELFIDASVEDEYGEITYTLDIYNKGGHKKLVEASFVDWDKLVEYVDDFIYNDSEADPEEDGSELDERFDMKTIKKQINDIVEKANG